MSLHKLLNEKTKSLGTLVDEGKCTDTIFSRSFKVGSISGELSVNTKGENPAVFILTKGEDQVQIPVSEASGFVKATPDFITPDEAKKLNKVFVPIVNRLQSAPKIAKVL
ncbi:hypothetical protein LMH73_019245 [Vibrio splendidus]|nr:hypothetical protein [Vibrio splendidus]MCC4880503.1 hypothetical protein [Vibrio splendidus]